MSLLKDRLTTWLTIIGLSVIFLGVTLPLRKNYIFDWDQAADYEAVEKIAGGKLTLIGPRVTSDKGFFLGPWHYYFLVPFFKLTNGSLEMGFWAVLLIQYLYLIITFWVSKKWGGVLAGIIAGILVATSGNIVEWGFMYVPGLSLLFLVICRKTLVKPKLLPWLSLFFGFGSTIYAVFYALVIPFSYVGLKLLIKKKIGWRKIFVSLGLGLLPYTPLFIFDLRHNFLNIRNMLGFWGGQNGPGVERGYFLQVFFRAIERSWINQELSGFMAIAVVVISLIILIWGGLTLFKTNKTLIWLWLGSSLIPLAFFHGSVSEYYYAPVILLIPIFLSVLLTRKGWFGKTVLVGLVITLVAFRINNLWLTPVGITLADKIEAVEELEKLGTKYSVSYEFKLGEDNGYTTVFRKIGHNYVANGSAQLFTLTESKNTNIKGVKIFSSNKLAIYKR